MIFVKRVEANLWTLTDEDGKVYSGKTATEVIQEYEKVSGNLHPAYTVGMDMEGVIKDIKNVIDIMKEYDEDNV